MDSSNSAAQSIIDRMHGNCESDADCTNGETNTLLEISSPSYDPSNPTLHYYIDVLNVEESMYEACKRNVGINTAFHAQLQQENEHDISTFFALPEIIPARKRKQKQPLLDFTRSKILTSQAYTEGCEHLLAQQEKHQAQARRKAAEKEATKEARRKEKEEKDLQVRAR